MQSLYNTYNMVRTEDYKDEIFEVCCGVRPCFGEIACGDEIFIQRTDDAIVLGVIDGLGHGVKAAAIAKAMKTFFLEKISMPIDLLLQQAHHQFLGSLGACVGIAKLYINKTVEFVGLGNVICKVFGDKQPTALLSKDGVLGVRGRYVEISKCQLDAGGVITLHSDGIADRLYRNNIPYLRSYSAAFVSKIIEDFGRQHDDVSFLIAKVLVE